MDTSSAELARLRARQEEKQRKKNSKKKYFSMQKADYVKIERELLADLDFLFDENPEGDNPENSEGEEKPSE